MGTRPSEQTRQVAVRDQFSGLQAGDETPNVRLKRRSVEPEREVEAPQTFPEICGSLPLRFSQHAVGRRAPIRFHAGKAGAADRLAVALDKQRESQRRFNRSARELHAGYNAPMTEKTPVPHEEREETRKEAVEAHEGDRKLDDYDKQVADSFPASDPPAQP